MTTLTTREQVALWLHVAVRSFGGPAGQIAVIHRLVVEERKLLSEERFLHALNFCMLLPGPEAQQLATYVGWLLGKWRGGVLAGSLFVLPGFLSILILSFVYVAGGELALVQGIFYGLKPAIVAVVLAALLRISRKSLRGVFHWGMAAVAFVSVYFFNTPFPFVVIGAALAGLVHGRFQGSDPLPVELGAGFPGHGETLRTLSVWLCLWALPIVVVILAFGEDSTFHALNFFFSKMAMVTFGGAYSALSYVAQQAVEAFGWVSGREMMDGLAIAETTPGPLIQTVQFVGFMAGYRFPDLASPYLSAFVGSVLTTWVTYAPCFLWIFTFAPYVEFIRGRKAFSDALRAITAAVVGVILNLSVWFVLKALFLESVLVQTGVLSFEYPRLESVDWCAAGICAVSLILQFWLKRGLFTILGVCVALGVLTRSVGG